MEIETAFSKGFRLGALFMIDVFNGKEQLGERIVFTDKL